MYGQTPGVRGVTLQDDGKVLVAGDFQKMGGKPHPGLARLENNPATQSLTQTSANRFQWLRGGASPEAQEVTFELSTDGDATWTPLGSGTRIAGGWEVNTPDHPPTGRVRARARIPCGDHNGSSGLIETTMAFNRNIAQWKLANLGDAYASDAGDPDGDGLPTLAEYALNFSPTTPNPPPLTRLPIPPECGGLSIFLTRDPARSEVTIEVQAANSPTGPWSTIAASAQGGVFTGSAYIDGDSAGPGLKSVQIMDPVVVTANARRFLRVKVTY